MTIPVKGKGAAAGPRAGSYYRVEPRIQYATTSDGVSIAYAALGEGRTIVFATRVWGDIHVYASVEQLSPCASRCGYGL